MTESVRSCEKVSPPTTATPGGMMGAEANACRLDHRFGQRPIVRTLHIERRLDHHDRVLTHVTDQHIVHRSDVRAQRECLRDQRVDARADWIHPGAARH